MINRPVHWPSEIVYQKGYTACGARLGRVDLTDLIYHITCPICARIAARDIKVKRTSDVQL